MGLVVAAMALSVALAQSPGPAGLTQGKPGAAYMLLFDASCIDVIEGTIIRLHQVPQPKVWLTSVRAQVRTRQGDLSVELGPSWFVDNQDLHLAVDDRISVTGSRVKANGVESLIALEVRRGNEVLALRSTDGTPVWVAWRWRNPAAGASR